MTSEPERETILLPAGFCPRCGHHHLARRRGGTAATLRLVSAAGVAVWCAGVHRGALSAWGLGAAICAAVACWAVAWHCDAARWCPSCDGELRDVTLVTWRRE